MLIPATTTKPGEPYDDLAELYGRMLGQWTLELNHVSAIVGGFETRQKHIGQEGVLFTPIAKTRQVEAVKFLNDNAFATPKWAIDREIIRRIEPIGELSRIRNAQNSVLNSLLSSSRFARLVEQEAIDGASAYSPTDFLADVRKGIWKELDTAQVKIDPYRRNLQRAYLDLVNNKINGSSPSLPSGLPAELAGLFTTSGEEKPLYRAELRSLQTTLGVALAKTTDRATRAHLEGARDHIAKILDPKFAPASSSSSTIRFFGFAEGQELSCWPDYMILP